MSVVVIYLWVSCKMQSENPYENLSLEDRKKIEYQDFDKETRLLGRVLFAEKEFILEHVPDLEQLEKFSEDDVANEEGEI